MAAWSRFDSGGINSFHRPVRLSYVHNLDLLKIRASWCSDHKDRLNLTGQN